MQVIHKYRLVVICLIAAGQILLFYLGATVKRNLACRKEPASASGLQEMVDSTIGVNALPCKDKDNRPGPAWSADSDAYLIKAGLGVLF